MTGSGAPEGGKLNSLERSHSSLERFRTVAQLTLWSAAIKVICPGGVTLQRPPPSPL